MAQNDFVIADQTASAALADINSALQSLASCSSGSTQPSVRYANQLWYDTSMHILKVRNEANSAWINILYVHQADGAVHILDNTYISDTSGNHVGLLGDQASSEWTTGTGTTESLVSPAKIAAAISALASVSSGQVMGYIAAASVGSVGSYGYFRLSAGGGNNTTVTYDPGYTVAGSSLYYSGSDVEQTTSQTMSIAEYATAPSGTWRLMGYFKHTVSSSIRTVGPRYSLWLRIS